MIRASLLYYNYTLLVIINQNLLKHKDVRNKNSPECIRTVVCIWLRGMDLNHRPPGYGPGKLPGCSTPRCRLFIGSVNIDPLGEVCKPFLTTPDFLIEGHRLQDGVVHVEIGVIGEPAEEIDPCFLDG